MRLIENRYRTELVDQLGWSSGEASDCRSEPTPVRIRDRALPVSRDGFTEHGERRLAVWFAGSIPVTGFGPVAQSGRARRVLRRGDLTIRGVSQAKTRVRIPPGPLWLASRTANPDGLSWHGFAPCIGGRPSYWRGRHSMTDDETYTADEMNEMGWKLERMDENTRKRKKQGLCLYCDEKMNRTMKGNVGGPAVPVCDEHYESIAKREA